MTVAVVVQVMDGLAVAADSTSTIAAEGNIYNTYDNANKVVNLCKGKPIGIAFWGAGSMGKASLSTLAKDLRQRLTGNLPDYEGWELKGDNWTVHGVAQRVRELFHDETYAILSDDEKSPTSQTGMVVYGFTPGRQVSEKYELIIGPDGCEGPGDENPDGDLYDLVWRGVTDPITRLTMGFGEQIAEVLIQDLGLQPDQLDAALQVLRDRLMAVPVHPAMPIQDAIDLAEFLVEATKQWVRFLPGAPTVGGPTEVAAVTKHEGFRWVKRKFFFDPHMNPGLLGEAS
jgi:hypothetical protein